MYLLYSNVHSFYFSDCFSITTELFYHFSITHSSIHHPLTIICPSIRHLFVSFAYSFSNKSSLNLSVIYQSSIYHPSIHHSFYHQPIHSPLTYPPPPLLPVIYLPTHSSYTTHRSLPMHTF